jgi:DNA-binding transcriptional MerR regulator
MSKSLAQIALDFIEETEREKELVAPMPDPPVNVGVRIKALKQEATREAIPVEIMPEPVSLVLEKPAPAKKAVKSTRGRKSMKQIEAEADLIEVPEDEELFKKQYYSIGEVAGMFKVNQSLLRYWEAEFDIIQPKKNKKGDRHFRPIDIKNLHLIYHLLRQRKYTIEGAKDFLKKNKKTEERFEILQKLTQVKSFLQALKSSL